MSKAKAKAAPSVFDWRAAPPVIETKRLEQYKRSGEKVSKHLELKSPGWQDISTPMSKRGPLR